MSGVDVGMAREVIGLAARAREIRQTQELRGAPVAGIEPIMPRARPDQAGS